MVTSFFFCWLVLVASYHTLIRPNCLFYEFDFSCICSIICVRRVAHIWKSLYSVLFCSLCSLMPVASYNNNLIFLNFCIWCVRSVPASCDYAIISCSVNMISLYVCSPMKGGGMLDSCFIFVSC